MARDTRRPRLARRRDHDRLSRVRLFIDDDLNIGEEIRRPLHFIQNEAGAKAPERNRFESPGRPTEQKHGQARSEFLANDLLVALPPLCRAERLLLIEVPDDKHHRHHEVVRDVEFGNKRVMVEPADWMGIEPGVGDRQPEIDRRATELLLEDPEAARAWLTELSHDACEEATEAYWRLGDQLWTKYDEKW